jgi:hypothetical protein
MYFVYIVRLLYLVKLWLKEIEEKEVLGISDEVCSYLGNICRKLFF